MAWGFKNGSLGSYEHFAARAQAKGYTWAALELDDHENYDRWADYGFAMRVKGLPVGGWYTHPANANGLPIPEDADFIIFEDESEAKRRAIVDLLERGIPAGPRYAVITDAWVYKLPDGQTTDIPRSRESTAPIVEAGLTCFIEVYAREPNGTPTGKTTESLEFVAREHLGYRDVQPCFGVFGGARLSDYDTSRAQWSVWLAESEGVL